MELILSVASLMREKVNTGITGPKISSDMTASSKVT